MISGRRCRATLENAASRALHGFIATQVLLHGLADGNDGCVFGAAYLVAPMGSNAHNSKARIALGKIGRKRVGEGMR